MSISKRTKQPRGYSVQGTKFLSLSEGVQPPLEAIPAPYLPLVEEDKLMEAWFVIQAGQIVAFDKTALNGESQQETNKKWLVLANGGASTTVTYAADDVDEVPDIDEYNSGNVTVVAAAGAASKAIAANIPAGFAPYNYYSSAHALVYRNFDLQPTVGFITDYLIEVPLIHDNDSVSGQHQSTLTTGCLVQPGSLGWPVFWDPSSDSVDQICGRCIRTEGIAVRDALDKVLTVPGLSLPGTGTSGLQLHENVYKYGTSTLVTRKARINITLL